MDKIIAKNKFSNNFLYVSLPHLFMKLVVNELSKEENKNIINYIKENYNISEKELIDSFLDNILITSCDDNILIYLDPNVYINNKVKIKTLIDLIDNGNLNIKGSKSITKIIDYINRNMGDIYHSYIIGRGLKIWE